MIDTDSALYGVYPHSKLAFTRGSGAYLYTAEGDRYLDFGSGIAVTNWGHAHPYLVAALTEQAGKLWHTSNSYRIPGQQRLASRLVAAVGFAARVFFCNSGTEAIECAIKTARRWHYAAGRSDRYRVITFSGAFHGRTLAALAATGRAGYLEGFGPPLEGFDQLAFGDSEAVVAAIDEQTAAILVEPIQGEGGIRPASPTFLRQLRRLCDDHNLALIYDEVQCGMGRSGTLFAHESAGAPPDIMALAKGLGGGFPIGACLARASMAAAMIPGTHGSTFGGNPLAMAVANAVLDLALEEDFLDEVRRKGLYLKQQLAALIAHYPQLFTGLRGEGLLLGLECKIANSEIIAALRDLHMLALPAADNIVRLAPPLTIDDETLRAGIALLEAACQALTSDDAAAIAVG